MHQNNIVFSSDNISPINNNNNISPSSFSGENILNNIVNNINNGSNNNFDNNSSLLLGDLAPSILLG